MLFHDTQFTDYLRFLSLLLSLRFLLLVEVLFSLDMLSTLHTWLQYFVLKSRCRGLCFMPQVQVHRLTDPVGRFGLGAPFLPEVAESSILMLYEYSGLWVGQSLVLSIAVIVSLLEDFVDK